MTSVKVKLRQSRSMVGMGCVCYEVAHARKVGRVTTAYYMCADEWDSRRGLPRVLPEMSRYDRVCVLRDNILADVGRLTRIIRGYERAGMEFEPDDVVVKYHAYMREGSLGSFMKRCIERLKMVGRIRTSETYQAAWNSFSRFLAGLGLRPGILPGGDVMIDAIDSEIMEDYQTYLRRSGLMLNTVSFYMRILRAVYNHAGEYGFTDGCETPFRHVYTGIGRTVKRALPLDALRRIGGLDLSGEPALGYARDMFMLSFFLRGMSFIDMAFLRRTDLHDGYLTYRRRKTGQLLTIAWTAEMQAIVDRYPSAASGYLLPIIKRTGVNERRAYLNTAYNINRSLKSVATLAEVCVPLTLYVARHSWASTARAGGVPLSVISEGMGHDSEATTRIYLASLDTSAVDHANRMVISAVV